MAVAIFSNTLRNDFIWDDLFLITDNPYIRDIKNIPLFFTPHYWNELHPFPGKYRPLRTAFLAGDYFFWKFNPTGYRITNLLFHTINVVLVFYFVLIFGARGDERQGGVRSNRRVLAGLAFLTALFFATHPIHVESINFAKNRSELLAFLFFLLSFILFIKHINADGLKAGRLFILGAWISFIPAVLAKEMALTLPGVLVLYTVCFVPVSKRKRSFIGIVPYGVIIFVYFWFLHSFVRPDEPSPVKVAIPGDIGQHVLTVIKTMGCYLKMLAVPFPLNAEHAFAIPTSILAPSVLIPLIILLLMCATVARTYQNSPTISFALGWIMLTLLPVANIVYFVSRPIAEQRLYIPSFGFCLILAYGLTEFSRIRSSGQHAFKLVTTSGLLIAVIVCLYSTITVFRNFDWRDGVTFYSKTIEINPNSARMHNNLGTTLNLMGRYKEAISSYEAALRLYPDYAQAYYNLGVSLLNMGKCEEAIIFYQAALRISPDYADVYCNLGVSFFNLGRYAEAIRHCQTALSLKPNYAKANYNLGICLFTVGRYEEAISNYQTVLRLDPGDIDAHYNLGLAFYKTERYEEAIRHYQTALHLKPGQVDVLINLGLALIAAQNYHQAGMIFSTILDIDPGHAQARRGYAFCAERVK